MGLVAVIDRGEIERFLRQDAPLHVYGLGDLDDFFFPQVEWTGWRVKGELQALFLLYLGFDLPVLMALEDKNPAAARELYQALRPTLPKRYYGHLSPYLVGTPGTHLKMQLGRGPQIEAPCPKGYEIEVLTPADAEAATAFYAVAHPRNWFDPRLLKTGQYLGIKRGGCLVSVAGVHVYSLKYRVAAVGNVATLPAHRGKGLASAVTAGLCRSLKKDVDLIGLNVKMDNVAAIKCYSRLGFVTVAHFHEVMAT